MKWRSDTEVSASTRVLQVYGLDRIRLDGPLTLLVQHVISQGEKGFRYSIIGRYRSTGKFFEFHGTVVLGVEEAEYAQAKEQGEARLVSMRPRKQRE